MKRAINAISDIDSDSFVFRYPEDKKENVSIQEIGHINFYRIVEIMDGIEDYFLHFDYIYEDYKSNF